MSAEAITICDWIEKKEISQRFESQSHIAAKENEEANTRKIGD